jgi:uncharacterized protein (DUF1810 family)
MTMQDDDPFGLRRFVQAQDEGHIYQRAVSELRQGRKTSHWMWFVFPQLAGLGRSDTSRYYGIASLDEARAYLAHQTLGPRLVECAQIVAGLCNRSAVAVFGPVDTQKLQSSMTLFRLADGQETGFATVLDRYFDGADDAATVRLIG